MKKDYETIIISGIAKLPEESVERHKFRLFSIGLEIRKKDSVIVGVGCLALLEGAVVREKLEEYLIGYEVSTGIANAMNSIGEGYYGTIKKTIIAGLKSSKKMYDVVNDNTIKIISIGATVSVSGRRV